MEVLAVTSDPIFNHFFSMSVYWSFILAGFFACLALFRA